MADRLNDIVHKVGGILLDNIHAAGKDWDYGGWVFGIDAEDYVYDLRFTFHDRLQGAYEFETGFEDAVNLMFDLREVTAGDDGVPWKKCLLVIRAEDKAIRFLFEFEDEERWSLTPSVLPRRFEVFVGDAFPEALEA